MIKQLSLFGLIVLCFGGSLSAQDIHFTQYQNTPTLINPATTGMFSGYQRAVLIHRSQWLSLGSPYQTFGVTFDMPVLQGKSDMGYLGVGFSAFKDQAGDSNFGRLNLDLSISGIIKVSKAAKVGVGIQAGFGQQSATVENLVFENQWNGMEFNSALASGEGNLLTSTAYADFATGVYYELNNDETNITDKMLSNLRFGVSYYHLTNPNIEFHSGSTEELLSKFIVHISARKDIPGTRVGLVPMAFVARQGPHQETNVGMMLRFKLTEQSRYTDILSQKAISFGLQHRIDDAWIPQVQLEMADFMFGLSYDLGVSDLKDGAKSLGSFEVSLGWRNIRKDVHPSKHRGRSTRL